MMQPMMDKSLLKQRILDALREQFQSRIRGSRAARDGGSDTESRAEGKYDTLSIEENYLADGLAKTARDAVDAAGEIEAMEIVAFDPAFGISPGDVVEVLFGDEIEWFFLCPAAGGTSVDFDRRTVTVITPDSPLGSRLMGRQPGDSLTAPAAKILSAY